MTKVYTPDGVQELNIEVAPNELVRGATWVRGSGQIILPVQDVDLYIAEACAIVGIIILTGDVAGACEVDVYRDSFGNFPPTSADTIFSGTRPKILAGGITYSDTVLSGVSTNCPAGSTLRFHLVSSVTFKHVSIFLLLRKT